MLRLWSGCITLGDRLEFMAYARILIQLYIIKQELDIRLKKAPIAFHPAPLQGLLQTLPALAGFSFAES